MERIWAALPALFRGSPDEGRQKLYTQLHGGAEAAMCTVFDTIHDHHERAVFDASSQHCFLELSANVFCAGDDDLVVDRDHLSLLAGLRF